MSFCVNCGNPVSETARFCSNCGTRVPRAQPSEPDNGISVANVTESRSNLNNHVVPPVIAPPDKTGAWLGRCKYCGTEIPVGANPCPCCGHELKWVRRPVRQSAPDGGRPAAQKPVRQAETVDLAQDLNNLGSWGFNNGLVTTFGSVFPGVGCLLGFLLLLLNPLWIATSAIFCIQGTERLKKGEIDGAQRSLVNGRFANWMMVFIGFIAWGIVFSSCGADRRTGRPPVFRPDSNTASEERQSANTMTDNMETREISRSVLDTETIKSTSEKTTSKPSTERSQDGVEVTESEFLDIVKAFNAHSGNDFRDRQLREPYKNRRIVVSGRIMEIKEGIFAAAKIKMNVHGKTVMAAFPSMSESTASHYNVGDYIQISGKPDLSLFYALDMNDCKYLGEATPPPQKPRQSTSEFEKELHQVFVDEIVSELLGGH